MQNFTVKKIHQKNTSKSNIENNMDEVLKIKKTKKTTRKFIFIILVLLGILFGINYAAERI